MWPQHQLGFTEPTNFVKFFMLHRAVANRAPEAVDRKTPEDTMSKTDFTSVDEYIASQPEAVQGILERVRSTIRKAVPGAEEVISYKIPSYKLRGVGVLFFAGWKQHYSLYPANERVVAAFKDELAPYEISKGTIRFPFSKPVPVKLIERIARFRVKEVAQLEKAKSNNPAAKSTGTAGRKRAPVIP